MALCLINKSWEGTEAGGVDYQVTIRSPRAFLQMESMYLKGTVTTDAGMSLGGKPISTLGTWDGHYTQTSGRAADGSFAVTVPAATAAIVRLR